MPKLLISRRLSLKSTNENVHRISSEGTTNRTYNNFPSMMTGYKPLLMNQFHGSSRFYRCRSDSGPTLELRIGAGQGKLFSCCLRSFSQTSASCQEDKSRRSNTNEVASGSSTSGSKKQEQPKERLHPFFSKSQIQALAQQIQTLPNLITLLRIACTPLLGYFIVTDQFDLALGGCVAAAFSDWLDGHIAKTYSQRTVLGTFLDPLADKFTIAVLSISLGYKEILPPEVVALWFSRDALLIGFTWVYIKRMTKDGEAVMDPSKTPVQAEPSHISKINTALQFLTIASGMTQSVFLFPSDSVLTGLCWTTAGTTIASGFTYLGGNALSPIAKSPLTVSHAKHDETAKKTDAMQDKRNQ